MESLINNDNLPVPVYSSGILSHRDQAPWRAQALIGLGQGGKLTIWTEYKENFSEQFEMVNQFVDIQEGYNKALKSLITRGYVVSEINRLSEAEIDALSDQFLNKTTN
jgi:hypothetical protein